MCDILLTRGALELNDNKTLCIESSDNSTAAPADFGPPE